MNVVLTRKQRREIFHEYSCNVSVTSLANVHNIPREAVIAALKECGVTDVLEQITEIFHDGFIALGFDLKPIYTDEELDEMTIDQMRLALATNASVISSSFSEMRKQVHASGSENTRLRQEVVRLKGRLSTPRASARKKRVSSQNS
ncbi:hypothetical protein ACQR3P_29200 [Rhodococcus sp. IEGM1300]